MRGLLLVLLLATTAAAGAAERRDALGAIDTCLAQLERGLDVGYRRISARCPDLATTLSASPWAASLPRNWNKPDNRLSAAGLEELRTLIARESARSAPAPELHVTRVAGVLAALSAPQQERRGWWTRFKDWLRELLARRPEQSEAGWLRQWLGELKLSDALIDAVSLGALALVMLLAGAIIVNELRIAGLLKARHGARPESAQAASSEEALTLRDIDRAAPSQRPRLLLELIAARLGRQERLPPARSLTVHELTRAARLPQETDRARLHELAAASESVRFAAREVGPEALASALACGRELLASLDAPPARVQGAA